MDDESLGISDGYLHCCACDGDRRVNYMEMLKLVVVTECDDPDSFCLRSFSCLGESPLSFVHPHTWVVWRTLFSH